MAYQGYARGIGIDEVFSINAFAIDKTFPDLTFYLDLAPEKGLERIEKNKDREVNRLDVEKLSFHKKVYEGYALLLKKYPERIVRIDASKTVEEETEEIVSIIKKRLSKDE